ncbi:MAG: hypothetical protein R3C18_07615 [Planctomycetaceae bacterium]
MTIRYECEGCGAVLKIKDELAGTDGKCPKCKAEFIIPEPEGAPEPPQEKQSAPSGKKPAPAKSGGKKGAPQEDDDFDVAAFLMEGDGPKPSPGIPAAPAQESQPRSGPKPITPPGARVTVPPPASASAAASAAMGASANARDLLTKTAEESRTRASSMPEEDARPKIDYSMALAQLRQYTPHIAGGFVVSLLLIFLSSYMFGNRIPLPELADVSGNVTLNGKPKAGLKVTLAPVESEGEATNGKKISLRSAVAVTDEDGFYRVQYMPGVRGAPLGKVKVTIEPVGIDMDVLKQIPPEYLPNSAAAVIREVREAGNADQFTFQLVGH